MTRGEAAAYDQGICDVLRIAGASAAAIERMLSYKLGRSGRSGDPTQVATARASRLVEFREGLHVRGAASRPTTRSCCTTRDISIAATQCEARGPFYGSSMSGVLSAPRSKAPSQHS